MLLLQISVIANDAATPNLQGETKVYINVRRNENRPIFSESEYVANINASFPQGVSIAQVVARDNDDLVGFWWLSSSKSKITKI